MLAYPLPVLLSKTGTNCVILTWGKRSLSIIWCLKGTAWDVSRTKYLIIKIKLLFRYVGYISGRTCLLVWPHLLLISFTQNSKIQLGWNDNLLFPHRELQYVLWLESVDSHADHFTATIHPKLCWRKQLMNRCVLECEYNVGKAQMRWVFILREFISILLILMSDG